MIDVKLNQLWQRKADGVLVAVREYDGNRFARVQNLRTARHFEVSSSGLRSKYELVGYDESEPAWSSSDPDRES